MLAKAGYKVTRLEYEAEEPGTAFLQAVAQAGAMAVTYSQLTYKRIQLAKGR